MTLNKFWTILIKVAGLYSLWVLLLAVPNYISMIMSSLAQGNMSQEFWSLLIFCFQPVILSVIAFLALLRTEICIKTLRLNTEKDDELLQLNTHRSEVTKIIVIMLGGYFFIDGLPYLFVNLTQFLQSTNNDAFYKDRTFAWLLAAVCKVTLGYCMIAYSRWFVNYIELKQRKA